jgi:hypothetical protein
MWGGWRAHLRGSGGARVPPNNASSAAFAKTLSLTRMKAILPRVTSQGPLENVTGVAILSRSMLAILFEFLTLLVLPIMINKTTEDRFSWLKPRLREAWCVIAFVYTLIVLLRSESEQYFMTLKRGFGTEYPVLSYFLIAVFGAALFIGYWWFLGKALPVKANDAQQQQEPKKSTGPQQTTSGDKSPIISGSNNTVIIGDDQKAINTTDPRVLSKLEEIKKLLLAQQGDSATPDKLLAKYPLGYVLFDVDRKSSVIPYATQSLVDQWDFDWSTVRLKTEKVGGQDTVSLRLPDMSPKGGGPVAQIQNVTFQGPLQTGPLGAIHTGSMSIKAEIVSIGPKGIVFLIGFDRVKHM